MTNAARKWNPADIALAAAANINSPKGTNKAGGLCMGEIHSTLAAGLPIVDVLAIGPAQTIEPLPIVSNPTLLGGAYVPAHPIHWAPRQEVPEWSSGHIALGPYVATDAVTAIVSEIRNLHTLRQGMLKAKVKLILQAKASIRHATQTDDDFASDDAKAAARKRNDALYAEVKADPAHPLNANLMPYEMAMGPLEKQADDYAKQMARMVKALPIYDWAKGVKGLGDVSLATIIGACGDIGTYKSVSAVWKRMGLAVLAGNRQGAPGKDATADDWIEHGYSGVRRSVVWNMGNSLILGMGKFRPVFGEDVQANPEYTYYQKVFAERCRYEAERLPNKDGTPVKLSKTGKESYSLHAANRAKRYVEKRLLKHLYLEWRRA